MLDKTLRGYGGRVLICIVNSPYSLELQRERERGREIARVGGRELSESDMRSRYPRGENITRMNARTNHQTN